ncbi:hypothetical protein Tco_0795260 [Tanacetum coccineum]
MVAYLQKPEGSEAFHQIMDFLNTSHIKYALIKNPKIYISLIQQFWGTATARTTDDGEVEITTSIDGQVKTITEASLRRHLKLEDSDGTLFSSVEFPTQTQVADEVAFISVDVDVGGAATTDIGLEAGQGSDEGTSWIQEDAEIQGKTSADTEILLDQEEPTKLVEDLGSGEKGEKEISTANISVSTASATPKVSIATTNLVYIRRSAEKRKDKGKAIMKEDESLQKEFDRARQEQEVVAEVDQAHDIDWSDPAMLRYHALQNRSFSVAESSKKRSKEDSDEDNAKKQKLEDDAEKEELRDSIAVVLKDDNAIDIESLATKYPIVDWKTHVLTENMMYYQIIRGDGSSKNYKIFSEMLDDFDRQDVLDLHRLVQERYDTTSPEGYDLLLWGDLKILFEPNEEDEIWKNQQDYNLIS